MTECWICGSTNTRPYLSGDWCPDHTPAKQRGGVDPYVDPAATLEALRARAGVVWGFNPNDTALVDRRAVESGRRASGARRRAAHG